MKSNDLLDLIGEAADEHIQDAKAGKRKNFPRWIKYASGIAACLVLLIGIGSFLLPRLDDNATQDSAAGGSGHNEGSVFMSYAGPVFPLTLEEENNAVSAQRNITMDFSPYTGTGDILVTDSYLLTNDVGQNQTVRVLYPFVSSLRSLDEDSPTLTLDGETLETTLYAGSYAGNFQGAWENWEETRENPGSYNLLPIDSWEGYQSLLSDGTYLEQALGGSMDLSDIPVTVYTFTDAWGPEEDDDAGIPNPSIRVLFEMDYEKTTVLSYGFNAGYYDSENGVMGKGFSISEEGERSYGVPCYLIVLGDDIENLDYQGYVTGGWDTETTVEAGVTITRTESDLETALRQAAGYLYQEWPDSGYTFDFELYFGLLKEHLAVYGVLSDNPTDRYDSGMLEELDIVGVDRVFWLEAEVTIPAGESVTLDATLKKEPSYDFECDGTENAGVSGYDLVTALGSNLTITQQTAKLEDRGKIEIVRQNFGFDLENGITEVTLDRDEPHYYLEVRGRDGDEEDFAVDDTDNQTDEKHHNLSVDGPFQVSENMNNDTSFVLEQYLETNSHEITITTNSDVPVVIDLYSDTDPDNPIRQLPLDSAETKSFTGLTSRFQYRIGISADTSTQINLTITD